MRLTSGTVLSTFRWNLQVPSTGQKSGCFLWLNIAISRHEVDFWYTSVNVSVESAGSIYRAEEWVLWLNIAISRHEVAFKLDIFMSF